MNAGSFRYLVRQGAINVWLNRLMSLASIGILTACFILVGFTVLLSLNIRDIFVSVESQNEMVVFLEDSVSESAAQTIMNNLESRDGVAAVVYVSKDEALQEQMDLLGDSGVLLQGLENDNPLPANLRVTLDDLSKLPEIQAHCQALPGVDSVSAPTNLAETLSGIRAVLLVLGISVIMVLVLTSSVVISNTVRLTVFSRRREINIMKYVGATNGFIRLPFMVEGALIGLVSAVLAFVALFGVYAGIIGLLAESTLGWVSAAASAVIPISAVWHWFLLGFVLTGMLIGLFGSSSSMRKHLRV